MLFEKALKAVLNWEGDYTNDPRDPGGETRYGISKRAYPDLNIWLLTVEEAANIYRADYWEKCQCDKFADPVAILLFDTAVNMGNDAAAKMLQSVVGVKVDGIIGPKTIHGVNMADPVWVVRELAAARMLRYSKMKNWDVYGTGWTRRLFDVALHAIK
jgi:lysozyme family protein